jgi:hypothetical protein
MFVSTAAYHLILCFLALVSAVTHPSHGEPLQHSLTKNNDHVHDDPIGSSPTFQTASNQPFPDAFVFGLPLANVDAQVDESSTRTHGQNHRADQDAGAPDDTSTLDDDEDAMLKPQDYVFVLYDDASPALFRAEVGKIIADFGEEGTRIMYEYTHVLKGFAVSQVSLALFDKITTIVGAAVEYASPVSSIAFAIPRIGDLHEQNTLRKTSPSLLFHLRTSS